MTLKTKLCGLAGATLLALSLGAVAPVPVYADTASDLQAKLDAANARLDDLYDQAGAVSEQLNGTKVKLAETQAQIDESNQKITDTQADIEAKTAELAERRSNLGRTVALDYKAGGLDFLSIILNANSFDDFISRVYYADKVSQQQADTIQQTKDLQTSLENQKVSLEATKTQLENQKTEQTQLLADQESQQASLNSAVADAEAYVNSLDADVKAKLAEEQEAARRQSEQEAAAARNEVANTVNNALNNANNGGGNGGTTNNGGGNNGGGASNNGGNSSNGGGSTGGGSSSGTTSRPQGSSSARQAVLDAAYSMIGSRYVYGACDPVGRRFDCSGFTMYCFAQAGISLPHYSESQAARTPKKPVSQLLPGDLVWHSGHVGIYAGNNMIIDAGNERVGVSLRPLYGGLGQWRGGWPA